MVHKRRHTDPRPVSGRYKCGSAAAAPSLCERDAQHEQKLSAARFTRYKGGSHHSSRSSSSGTRRSSMLRDAQGGWHNPFRKPVDPKELVRKWQSMLRTETRHVDTSIREIQRCFADTNYLCSCARRVETVLAGFPIVQAGGLTFRRLRMETCRLRLLTASREDSRLPRLTLCSSGWSTTWGSIISRVYVQRQSRYATKQWMR